MIVLDQYWDQYMILWSYWVIHEVVCPYYVTIHDTGEKNDLVRKLESVA